MLGMQLVPAGGDSILFTHPLGLIPFSSPILLRDRPLQLDTFVLRRVPEENGGTFSSLILWDWTRVFSERSKRTEPGAARVLKPKEIADRGASLGRGHRLPVARRQ